ncbi:hypothetical protein MRS44_004289 [Fusarium solani]|uniref:uncharacterized protein n=1 Tax=Fusarium solani TaxID=169388 RepID=UPI0032C42AD2|nr:hypothetical protein MRS44_004289 [Fusarium solani]
MSHEKPHDNPRKLTEDMPLGARIGMNIILAAAPPTLRRHAIRRLEGGPRPIRKTRAERQREWEIEQARRAREGTSRSDWTPQASSPCPWDEDEGSGSDSEIKGVGALGADEEQVESRESRAPALTGNEPYFMSGMEWTDTPSRSSQPPGFTREPSQNPLSTLLRGGRRELTQQGRNKKKRRETPPPTCRKLPAAKWSSQVDGVPDDLRPVDDGRTSVSTAWPGPHTDAGDEVGPSESISVIGDEAEDGGLYRRGKIAPSSRESAKQSESTKWSQ